MTEIKVLIIFCVTSMMIIYFFVSSSKSERLDLEGQPLMNGVIVKGKGGKN